MGESDFWNYREKAQEVVVRLKGLKSLFKPLDDTVRAADDLAAMIEMAAEDVCGSRAPTTSPALGIARRTPGLSGKQPSWRAFRNTGMLLAAENDLSPTGYPLAGQQGT